MLHSLVVLVFLKLEPLKKSSWEVEFIWRQMLPCAVSIPFWKENMVSLKYFKNTSGNKEESNVANSKEVIFKSRGILKGDTVTFKNCENPSGNKKKPS